MFRTETWRARVLTSFADVERCKWAPLFGTRCRGYDYFLACEAVRPSAFALSAIAVFQDDQLIAGGPLFQAKVSLEEFIDGPAKPIVKFLGKLFTGLRSVPVVGLGSPYSEELSLGFLPSLSDFERRRALAVILEELETHARGNGMSIVLAKMVSDQERTEFGPAFTTAGFNPIAAPPLALMRVPESDEAYMHALSANMRSNLRRKLKKSTRLRLEVRTSTDGIDDDLHAMRSATVARAKTDFGIFGQIPPTYYRTILERMSGQAYLRLFWLEERLVGFALILASSTEISETYTGMIYPEGTDAGLFFLNWMIHIKEARALGMKQMDAGVTSYLAKARLGCRFHRTWIYVRMRNRLFNWLIGKLAAELAFDKSDPDLQELGAHAPYDETTHRS